MSTSAGSVNGRRWAKTHDEVVGFEERAQEMGMTPFRSANEISSAITSLRLDGTWAMRGIAVHPVGTRALSLMGGLCMRA